MATPVVAMRVDPSSFATLGRYLRLADGEGAEVICSTGDGWHDVCTRQCLIEAPTQLGMTLGSTIPSLTRAMERHTNAEEAVLCVGSPIVLPLAPVTGNDYPHVRDVRAVILEPGDVVVLKPGVWHAACLGLSCPTPYFWLAHTSGEPNSWVPIVDGPVEIIC